MFMRNICSVVLLAFALMLLPSKAARAASDDGIVRIKSAYSMPETIKRIKKDVADKGIMFFDEIDQSKLAADAGVTLRPSTLIVFGNPPLGTLFLTSNPSAGLDWPVRVLVYQDEKGDVWVNYTGFHLDRPPARNHGSRRRLQEGIGGDHLDYIDRSVAI